MCHHFLLQLLRVPQSRVTTIPLSSQTSQYTERVFTLSQTYHIFLSFCVFTFSLCSALSGSESLLRLNSMIVSQPTVEISRVDTYWRTIMEYDRLRSVAKGLSNYQHYAHIFHKAPAGNDTVSELHISNQYTHTHLNHPVYYMWPY